jgi:pseudoazurin
VRSIVSAFAAFLAGTTVGPAQAKEWQVTMVNHSLDGAMAFTPGFLHVAPGDTVRFVAQNQMHNAESIAGLVPIGAPLFHGTLSQDLTVTFIKPGLYGYKCAPHFSMGMVGLVRVGNAAKRAAFSAGMAKLPPLARERMTNYLAQAQ